MVTWHRGGVVHARNFFIGYLKFLRRHTVQPFQQDSTISEMARFHSNPELTKTIKSSYIIPRFYFFSHLRGVARYEIKDVRPRFHIVPIPRVRRELGKRLICKLEQITNTPFIADSCATGEIKNLAVWKRNRN